MKTFAFVSFFFFLSVFCFAQHDSTLNINAGEKKKTFGVDISYFTNLNLYFNDGFNFTTSLTVSKENHGIALGPVWWLARNEYQNFFKGGMISYSFYPLTRAKRINFYFMYEMSYTFEKNDWEKYMLFTPVTKYNVSFASTSRSLKNQLGYGFKFYFGKKLYVTQSMVIGVECYNYTSETNVKEKPVLSSTYSSGNIFSASQSCSFIKTGFGYEFK